MALKRLPLRWRCSLQSRHSPPSLVRGPVDVISPRPRRIASLRPSAGLLDNLDQSRTHIQLFHTSRVSLQTQPPPSRTPESPKEISGDKRKPATKQGSPDSPKKRLIDRVLSSETHENIYTLPNLLTVSRILACPVLAHAIVDDQPFLAASLLAYCAASDLADGTLARRYGMKSVLGTILDPAADKILMTTMVLSLSYKALLPLPLAGIIIGRDLLLSLSAFYFRYASLPPPKTFGRFWDFSLPSAEVKPTQISKYNTFLQLVLVGTTTIDPLLPFDISMPLTALQWTVGATTIWSGLSYIFSKDAIRYLR